MKFDSTTAAIVTGGASGLGRATAEALAAVGATGSINFLVLGFCIGICNGFVIPVAQKFGEGDEAGRGHLLVGAGHV